MANLIGMNANQVPTNGMLGTLAFRDTVPDPVSNVTTATTATTLTSTPTLLQITPASYGVAVTLPDATTCSVGGPPHIIDNKGAYPVRVLNSSGTLLGFIFAGVVSHISLIDNSSAAGVWTIENNELVGASAQLLTNSFTSIQSVVDIGSNKEVLVGGTGANGYAVVYDRSTNTFGSVTLVRAAGFDNGGAVACLSGANQVLVVSCVPAAAAFEAVTLSISGTTITVNTAATATLSANFSAFADGCGLIAVGSSFVTSYTVATPAAQIRALSISGTTVTIGSATVLDGTAGGLIAASSDKVIAVSAISGTQYFKPYTVSGSSIGAGTGATKSGVGTDLYKFGTFSSGRFFVILKQATTSELGGVVLTLSGTTISASTLVTLCGGGLPSVCADAIVVGSNKVLVLSTNTTNNANILTDTAGTVSAGVVLTLDGQTARACLYVDGTNVAVSSGDSGADIYTTMVDCSGASPVKTKTYRMGATGNVPVFAASNSVLSKAATSLTGTTFAQRLLTTITVSNAFAQWRVKNGEAFNVPVINPIFTGTAYRGKADSERWVADAATLITKFECVV